MKKAIAIVGIGAVLPGAMDFSEYWSNILEGKDCIRDIPDTCWKLEDFYDPDPMARDKTYGYRGGTLAPISFDSIGYGIPPVAMEAISVEHLYALVVAKQALLDADMIGKSARPFNREKTGVLLAAGIGKNAFSYSRRQDIPKIRTVLENSGVPEVITERVLERLLNLELEWTENSEPGFLANVTAGRIAGRFDLQGPNCAIDAACASSLAVMRFASNELYSGDCDVVLAGGVNLDMTATAYISFCKTPAISRNNRSMPFAEGAEGMLLGDGVVMVVLKRLADAERDGDRIYAVVRGVGASGDGRAKSIFAPRREGQILALRRAYEKADVNPADVSLVEAHGTGTEVGDGCEVSSLSEFFEEHGVGSDSIVIGSVKSQIGHTRLSAGMAGLVKTALSLYHQTLPPTINVDRERSDIRGTPFYTLNESLPWIVNRNQPVRKAGLSGFGFGGTNFHVVLEEYDGDAGARRRVQRSATSVCFHDRNREGLIQMLGSRLEQLKSDPFDWDRLADEQRDADPPEQAETRIGFVAKNRDEAIKKMESALSELDQNSQDEWRNQAGVWYMRRGLPADGGVVTLFPGQGSQYMGMFRRIALHYPEMRRAFGLVDDALIEKEMTPVSRIVYSHAREKEDQRRAEAMLMDTRYTQPALAATCGGLYEILRTRGYREDFIVGHSFGEITGLWAGGAVDSESFARITIARGQVMAESGCGAETGMIAVAADSRHCAPFLEGLEQVVVANENSPSQTVMSGDRKQIEDLASRLRDGGVSASILKVSCGFHSPFMAEGNQRFQQTLQDCGFQDLEKRVYAGAQAKPYEVQAASVRKTLAQQIESPVLFRSCIENVWEQGARVFVEVGPGRVLSNLTAGILKGKDHRVVTLDIGGNGEGIEGLEEGLLQLRMLGMKIKGDPYQRRRADWDKDDPPKSAYMVDPMVYMTPEKVAVVEAALNTVDTPSLMTQGPDREMNVVGNVNEAPFPNTDTLKGVNNVQHETLEAVLGLQNLNGQALDRFLSSQGIQIEAFRQMLAEASTAHPEELIRFMELFQNNSMKAYESYMVGQRRVLGGSAGMEAEGGSLPAPSFPSLPSGMAFAADPPAGGRQAPASAGEQSPSGRDSGGSAGVLSFGAGSADPGISGGAVPQTAATFAGGSAIPSMNGSEAGSLAGAGGGAGSAVDETPVAAGGLNAEELSDAIIQIICEKTGYPPEMVDADMNIESDLGIDSIKRVEIFSILNAQIPDGLNREDIEALATLHTIREISDYLANRSDGAASGAGEAAGSISVPAEGAAGEANMIGAGGAGAGEASSIGAPNASGTVGTVGESNAAGVGSAGVAGNAAVAVGASGIAAAGNAIAAGSTGTAGSTGAAGAIKRYDAVISELPPITDTLGAAAFGGLVMITIDNDGLSERIAEILENRGYRTILVNVPGLNKSRVKADCRTLTADEEEMGTLFASVCAEYDAVLTGFVHVASDIFTRNNEYFSKRQIEVLKTIFLSAKYFRRDPSAEKDAFFAGALRLDGYLGTAEESGLRSADALHGAIFGLLKSLQVEWGGAVQCKAVDLDRGLAPREAAACFIEELFSGDHKTVEIGRAADGVRRTLTLSENEPSDPDLEPDETDVFFVTGGGRGITASCVVELARRCRSKFILLGRTDLDADMSWAGGETDKGRLRELAMQKLLAEQIKATPSDVEKMLEQVSAQRDVNNTIRAITEAGAQARYYSCDVTDQRKLKRIVAAAEKEFGPITGFIHGAGSIADKKIQRKTLRDFDQVFGTKILGLETCLKNLSPDRLKYLVFFSSVAGWFGNSGQSDYAMANEVMNKFACAFRREYPRCKTVSINWGLWDVGMVSDSIKNAVRGTEIEMIPVDVGVSRFLDQFVYRLPPGVCQIVVNCGAELIIPSFSFADMNAVSERALKIG